MPQRRYFLGFLLASAGLVTGALAQSDDDADEHMTKLSIKVTNDSDKPVERASVIIRFVKGRSYQKFGHKLRDVYELRTNQYGEASIPEIPQGQIMVQIIAHGYQTFGQTFNVKEAERTIAVKLNAPQPQYSAH
jgi:hypothetical protein